MTVRVERSFDVEATPERVWEFIADPENRARAISVVEEYEVDPDDPSVAVWHVSLPIPLLNRTARVETHDVDRQPPEFVSFVGKSSVMRVRGEHRIERTDEGCRVTNRFVVDGRLPGVERYFKRNLDAELENLEGALRVALGVNVG